MRPDAADSTSHPLGAGFRFERRRDFVRKTVTLGVAILALGPVVYWKHALGAAIYLAILVLIHLFALVVFLRRVPWRGLFAHPGGLLLRVGGLLAFLLLLRAVPLEGGSPWFWPALTLLWVLHVGALALLHVRHRAELHGADGQA